MTLIACSTFRSLTFSATLPPPPLAFVALLLLLLGLCPPTASSHHTASHHIISQVALLQQALSSAPLFAGLDAEWQQALFNTMTLVSATAGDVVIQQGEPGDSFFVVHEGTLEVRVVPAHELHLMHDSEGGNSSCDGGNGGGNGGSDAAEAEAEALAVLIAKRPGHGRVVHQYGPGGRFGELALLYDRPRAASVVATTDCKLWRLERWAFEEVSSKSSEVQARALL